MADKGQKLGVLEDKTYQLAQTSSYFRGGAARVRNGMRNKDMKMCTWLIAGLIVLLLIIIIPSGEHRLAGLPLTWKSH